MFVSKQDFFSRPALLKPILEFACTIIADVARCRAVSCSFLETITRYSGQLWTRFAEEMIEQAPNSAAQRSMALFAAALKGRSLVKSPIDGLWLLEAVLPAMDPLRFWALTFSSAALIEIKVDGFRNSNSNYSSSNSSVVNGVNGLDLAVQHDHVPGIQAVLVACGNGPAGCDDAVRRAVFVAIVTASPRALKFLLSLCHSRSIPVRMPGDVAGVVHPMSLAQGNENNVNLMEALLDAGYSTNQLVLAPFKTLDLRTIAQTRRTAFTDSSADAGAIDFVNSLPKGHRVTKFFFRVGRDVDQSTRHDLRMQVWEHAEKKHKRPYSFTLVYETLPVPMAKLAAATGTLVEIDVSKQDVPVASEDRQLFVGWAYKGHTGVVPCDIVAPTMSFVFGCGVGSVCVGQTTDTVALGWPAKEDMWHKPRAYSSWYHSSAVESKE